MSAIIKAAICAFGGVGVVFWACRRAGRSWDWIGRHLPALILAAFAVAFATAWASEKPAPAPPATVQFWQRPAEKDGDRIYPLMPTREEKR